MRKIGIVVLVCIALGTCPNAPAPIGSPADRAAIQAVLDEHGRAWSKGDAAAAAAVVTEDADWVSSDGSTPRDDTNGYLTLRF